MREERQRTKGKRGGRRRERERFLQKKERGATSFLPPCALKFFFVCVSYLNHLSRTRFFWRLRLSFSFSSSLRYASPSWHLTYEDRWAFRSSSLPSFFLSLSFFFLCRSIVFDLLVIAGNTWKQAVYYSVHTHKILPRIHISSNRKYTFVALYGRTLSATCRL